MKKRFSIMLIFTLLLTLLIPFVDVNANSHSASSLFDFHSGRDKAQDRYDKVGEEGQNNAPISNMIKDESMNTKRMIVLTKEPLNESKQKELLGKLGNYNRSLPSVVGFSAYIPESNVDILLRHKDIEDIYVDSVVTTMGYKEPIPSDVVSAPIVWEEKSNKGNGVGVAVLDTGVYPHKDLSITGFKDFVNNKAKPYDDNGHGTHVAGLVSGNGTMSNGLVKGVAPEVDIIGVKVLDSREKGYVSNVVSGIEWVIQNKNKYNIKVINLSLGTSYNGTEDPLMRAVERATKEGLTVVVAGGNTGYNGKVTSPAVSKNAIAVGSMDTQNTLSPYDDTPSIFSVMPQTINGSKKPEIYAPGTNSISTLSFEGNRTYSDTKNIIDAYYYRSSGTSMATPVVSGVAALLYKENPSITPNEVKNKLVSNSIKQKGVNVLNAAKVFNLKPNWETTKNEGVDIEIPKPIFEKEVVEDKPVEEEKGVTEDIINNDNENSSFIVKKEVEDGDKENSSPFLSEDKKDEPYRNDTIFSPLKVDEGEKENAEIPSVNPYIDNDGYPFVKEVYEKRDILSELIENSSNYKNGEEIEYEYESIKDIVKLFNLINRSFNRQDFLYFEQRMNN